MRCCIILLYNTYDESEIPKCSCNVIEFGGQNSDANLSNLISMEILYVCNGISAYAPRMINLCLLQRSLKKYWRLFHI